MGSVAVQRPREEEHLDRVKTKGDNGAVAAGDNGEPYRRKQLCPPQTTRHMRPNVAGAGSGDNEANQGDGREKLIRSLPTCFIYFFKSNDNYFKSLFPTSVKQKLLQADCY